MQTPIQVDYYSDILCVWAWIAQPRLDELQKQWGEHIEIRHRFVDIFGDARNKIPRQWGEQDGFEKFHQHVVHAATDFDHCAIHADIWRTTRPATSMTAHLVLKATDLVAGDTALEQLALAIRRAFFCDAVDVGNLQQLYALAEGNEIAVSDIERVLRDGTALAALSGDLRSASDLGVRGSPTWALNQGRQLLYGNVGYRILSANIEELINKPAGEASWC